MVGHIRHFSADFANYSFFIACCCLFCTQFRKILPPTFKQQISRTIYHRFPRKTRRSFACKNYFRYAVVAYNQLFCVFCSKNIVGKNSAFCYRDMCFDTHFIIENKERIFLTARNVKKTVVFQIF